MWDVGKDIFMNRIAHVFIVFVLWLYSLIRSLFRNKSGWLKCGNFSLVDSSRRQHQHEIKYCLSLYFMLATYNVYS